MKIKGAMPMKNHMLDIEMADSSRIIINMKKHLDTIQFCALKNKSTWQNIFINEDCIYWKEKNGSTVAQMSPDTVMDIFSEGAEEQQSPIEKIDITEYINVHITMKNKSEAYLSMDGLIDKLKWYFVW